MDRISSPTAINVVGNVSSNESVEEYFENDNREPNSAKLENLQIPKPLDTFVYNRKRTTQRTDQEILALVSRCVNKD